MARRGTWTAVAAAIAMAAAPAQAAPDDVTFEGESMALPAGGNDVDDARASGGRAKLIWGNATATRAVTTTRSTVHVLVRARSDWCEGDPNIVIEVGGARVYSGPVRTSEYSWIGARASAPAGARTVSISLTNDYSRWVGAAKVCDRNVRIDQVTLVASPFAANGWRNRPLPANAPLASNSSILRDELIDQIHDHMAGPNGAGAWVNRTSYSIPVYVVPPDQPVVRVRRDPLLPSHPALEQQWSAVPLPAEARQADGTDGHLLVWQPSTDTLWEFWRFRRLAGNEAIASYGGRMTSVSQGEGHFVDPPLGPGRAFGASATSISLLAGLQRIEEIRRGEIDHAIDFTIVAPRGRTGFCWPAQRTDGAPGETTDAPEAIPAGTRFRLPADLDLDAYAADPEHPLPPYTLTVAKAIQRYGMVVRDKGGVVAFFAEDPIPTGSDPYPGFFGGLQPHARPGGLFEHFPWHELEALAPAGTGCTFGVTR